jgi:HD-GYP domain-containing protein (c-di-GMP phosphodiesterase class II)
MTSPADGTAHRPSAPLSEEKSPATLVAEIERLQVLFKVGVALSAEKNRDRLMELILLEAKKLCNADGGTLYIRDEQELSFEIMRSDTLGIALGGTTGEPIRLQPLPLCDPTTGAQNLHNVATAAANLKRSFNIIDAYSEEGFDFSGTKAFDQAHAYHSRSFLTIPLVNHEDFVIGVLQLLNAKDPGTGEVTHFTAEQQNIVEALASQAGIALDNQLLLDGQKELLESFIKMIASAIDAKSPYTGGHCERVPILTLMIVQSLCEAREGKYADFELTAEQWYELQIAAWLHDCGKVTTPVHVMDKATKLETIFDRLEIVRARFEVLRRDVAIDYLSALQEKGADAEALARQRDERLEQLEADLAFLEVANVGGEYMSPDKQARVREIAARRYRQGREETTLLSEEEVANLLVSRGTLTQDERVVINGHMVQTIKMLEALPFPRHLKKVPEYAGGHHEKMDGTGYPRGIFAGDMSIPARAMAVADVFEALTAQDRPYKSGKSLGEVMRIMGFMKRDNHLDPDLLDHFVRSGVYREYARKFLPPELIDEVDEASLLAIEPKAYDVPPDGVRRERFEDFLPEYQAQAAQGEQVIESVGRKATRRSR